METTKTEKLLSTSAKELSPIVKTTVKDLIETSKSRNYRISGEESLDLEKIEVALANLSTNQRKKVRDSINRVTFKPSLANINLFFHTISKRVLESDSRVRVKVPLAEEIYLQDRKDAKKAWKDSQQRTEKLRVAYREIKRKPQA